MSVSCQSLTGLLGAESLADFSLGTDCLRGPIMHLGRGTWVPWGESAGRKLEREKDALQSHISPAP